MFGDDFYVDCSREKGSNLYLRHDFRVDFLHHGWNCCCCCRCYYCCGGEEEGNVYYCYCYEEMQGMNWIYVRWMLNKETEQIREKNRD